MANIEKFKPVKHTEIFELMYDEALNSIKYFSGTIDEKINEINRYKNTCLFNKNILIYKDTDDIIGFCMYEKIDDIVFIIFDYVDIKFKGKGRICRQDVFDFFSDKCAELKFYIHKDNFLSKNSITKLDNKRNNQ